MIRLSLLACTATLLLGCARTPPAPAPAAEESLEAPAPGAELVLEGRSSVAPADDDIALEDIQLENLHLDDVDLLEINFDSKDPKSVERVSLRDELEASRSFLVGKPLELQFGCVVVLDSTEESLADKLKSRNPQHQLLSAQQLWRKHSRRQAASVLQFCDEMSPVSPAIAKFQQECANDCQPHRILEQLLTGDYRWGAWLASLRPHPSLVTVLLEGLEKQPDLRPETLFALGKSKDPRARKALVKVLLIGKDMDSGFAASALGDFGGESVEDALLLKLGNSEVWCQANICVALGKIGTGRSLPALEPIAASTRYTGAIGLRRVAQDAIGQIKDRLSKDQSL